MPGPLSGVRVLDLTHVLNGPFCTLLLAHMGAEVIKLEYGAGDRFRHAWMPPNETRDGYEFIATNSNKKGIVLDLKTEEGKRLFRELVKKSDVVVENFTMGVMDRMGLGYDDLQKINPRIIYACSRGFGESGPYKHVRANAATIGAIGGWTDTGMRNAKMPGIKVANFGDETAGVSMSLGILGALYGREQTGEGQKVVVSMQEAQIGFMVSSIHEHFEGTEVGRPTKPCKDGYYAFHLPDITDDQWVKLTASMGRPELGRDPRFLTLRDRRKNYGQVEEEATAMVADKTRAEIWKVMCDLGLSSAPVLTIAEMMEDEHLKERGAFVEVDHPQAGKVKVLAPWIRFSKTPGAITGTAPAMGQHNREIYGGLLGLSEAEIQDLEAQGVIAAKKG